MEKIQQKIDSKIGPLYLVASEKYLNGIFWKRQAGIPIGRSAVISRATKQIGEYLSGVRKRFDIPLRVDGTPFQKSVWKELSRIPYGKTVSYKDVARRIRRTKAVRAVGNANGKNPICIVVPCHRVIANDGSLGGYSGRSGVKGRLLALEKANR